MSILDDSLAEVERKCQFDCDKNYSDEEMVQMTADCKNRIPLARIKYYFRKFLNFILRTDKCS